MTADQKSPGPGLMLTDDLIFFSRVAATARAQELRVLQMRTAAALVQSARQQAPPCAIVDLHNEGLDLPRLLVELREVCPAMPRVIAYGSHVEAETLRAAEEAGCDRVMPRSKFVKELEGELGGWLSGEARRSISQVRRQS